MKPSFALDFRNSAVTLLHRTANGWHEVGAAALDTPDLTEAMGYLRSTALGLAPRGLSTKVVIPNDQILYTKVVAPGPDTESRRAQIMKALEGRTPYAVDDLVFDWSGSGPEVQVAVIARETLDEAEAFAVEHRLNPLAFVAVPEARTFRGEPWFGTSSLAPTLLAQNDTVERDLEPVSIIARGTQPGLAGPEAKAPKARPPEARTPEARTPETKAKASRKSEAETLSADSAAKPTNPANPRAAAEPQPSAEAEQDAKVSLAAEPEPAPETAPAHEQALAPDPAPDAAAALQAAVSAPMVSPVAALLPEPAAMIAAAPDPHPAASAAEAPRPMAQPEAPPPASAVPAPVSTTSDTEDAPVALDVPLDDLPPVEPSLPAKPPLGDMDDDDEVLPPMPSAAARMAFASRRTADGAKPPVAPAPSPRPSASDLAKPISAKPLVASPPLPGANGAPKVTAPAVERPFPARPLPAAPPRAAKPVATDPQAAKAARGLGALVTAPGIAGSKASKSARPARQDTGPATATAPAARPKTDPAKRKSNAVRGKPRYLGLILTGLLLLFLAVIAAWSSYSLAFWQSAPTDTAVATTAAPADQISAPQDLPAPADEIAADLGDLAVDPAAPVADVAATPAPAAATGSTQPGVAPVTGAETQTGPTTAPVSEAQDEIFLATMDPPPVAPDPLALPEPAAASDALPQQQPAPPAFGTVYQFDANGLIVPTKEGIVTPEGVRLVAGKPPVLPPERPAGLTAAAPTVAADTTAAPVATASDQTAAPFPSDPALAKFRPKERPAGLAPAVQQQGDASPALADGTKVASLRPKARPAAILAAGEAARQAAAQASLATQAAAATPDAGTSKLAVAISRRPEPRPRDLSRSVEAAVAAAVQTPDPQPTVAPTDNSVAALDDSEPEVVKSNPRIPTKASVAKQATYANVLNLSKINLIGVYGSQSNRYALVRQANGRYKKVKIGDSIDGGRVAAITDTEVRYQKGSKMLTLAMPKG